jgi:hypothetical protein
MSSSNTCPREHVVAPSRLRVWLAASGQMQAPAVPVSGQLAAGQAGQQAAQQAPDARSWTS